MPLGMLTSVVLQTVSILAFILILTPFRDSVKRVSAVLGCVLGVLTIFTCCFALRFGTIFLMRYGFFVIGIPLFIAVYILSSAKGIRFAFIALTAVVLQQMLLTLLMAFRICAGGFTILYFLLNFIAFGTLLAGGLVIRKDFHKIIFSYRYEFYCITAILLLLFLFAEVFSPITSADTVDPELLLIILFLDLLVVLFFLYIGVSFHSLSKRVDAQKDALALRFQMEEMQKHLSGLRAAQERSFSWHQNRQRHVCTMRALVEQGETEKLLDYLNGMEEDLDHTLSETYCQNEAVNLLLASYSARAAEWRVPFVADTQLPGNLSIGVTELCTLLGSALDNAFLAARALDETAEKTVRLMAKLSDGKLLVQVQNPYTGEVRMENGLPQVAKEGTGFGVKSMEAIVEKCGGLSSYQAVNGIFTARFAI